MRLTFDPVVSLHRPLAWYLVSSCLFNSWHQLIDAFLASVQIVGSIDFYSSMSMRARGFIHYTTPGWFRCFPPRPLAILSKQSADPDLSYWYRPHRSTTKLPILYLHGIGVCIFDYHHHISSDTIVRFSNIISKLIYRSVCGRTSPSSPTLSHKILMWASWSSSSSPSAAA
jgi:hypothetical protein